MEHELAHLITDPAHWQFELISTVVFDLVTFLVILPVIGAWKRHHRNDHEELNEMADRLALLELEMQMPTIQSLIEDKEIK